MDLFHQFHWSVVGFWYFWDPLVPATNIAGWNTEPLKMYFLFWLVVSTHLKHISQNGNLPQVGVKTNNWNHHLVFINGDIPASYVSLPEGNRFYASQHWVMVTITHDSSLNLDCFS